MRRATTGLCVSAANFFEPPVVWRCAGVATPSEAGRRPGGPLRPVRCGPRPVAPVRGMVWRPRSAAPGEGRRTRRKPQRAAPGERRRERPACAAPGERRRKSPWTRRRPRNAGGAEWSLSASESPTTENAAAPAGRSHPRRPGGCAHYRVRRLVPRSPTNPSGHCCEAPVVRVSGRARLRARAGCALSGAGRALALAAERRGVGREGAAGRPCPAAPSAKRDRAQGGKKTAATSHPRGRSRRCRFESSVATMVVVGRMSSSIGCH